MRLEAVFHRPMSEYCHGLDEKHIVYRLRSARDDLRQVTLAYGDTACRQTPILFTPVPMEKIASDPLFDYWQAVVESSYERVYYYFELFDGESSMLYYGDVFSHQHVDDRSQYFKLPFNHRADLAKVPSWVLDAVVYNIFPDSFATGKGYLSCRATQQDYRGQSVHGKLGGTLRGVTENADYLLHLGINCVYLNPIFAAGEYHKYDLLDYYHVDPVFGGDEAFREMVQTLHANMFFDDGEGYINLGLDTVYDFDEYGNLLAPAECTWIAINEQPVAYYHESTIDDGEDYTITGRVPVLYNGERAELVLEFTDEDPKGDVVGVRTVYTNGETATVPKTMDPVAVGDTLDFVCDYYSYDGEYLDSYLLGDPMIVDGELVISDVYVDAEAANLTFRFTDIYNQEYWSEPVPMS